MIKRRAFLAGAGGVLTASAAAAVADRTSPGELSLARELQPAEGSAANGSADGAALGESAAGATGTCARGRAFNGPYEGAHLSQIAFPMGGFGAGMVCLEGTGALSHVSVRHRPELKREPGVFAALSIKGSSPIARVLEGPVPERKRRFEFSLDSFAQKNAYWGLPRYQQATFTARFPFARIVLSDETVPVAVTLTGWSPFEPGDADNASLPVASLEYELTNTSPAAVEGVFSFNAENFMAQPVLTAEKPPTSDAVKAMPGGFLLYGAGSPERPWDAGTFAVWVDDPAVQVNAAWFRGSSLDSATLAWRDVQNGACYARPAVSAGEAAPGASLFVPFTLAPGAKKTIGVRLAWYVPRSNLKVPGGGAVVGFRLGTEPNPENEVYRPWYSGRFADIDAVAGYWRENYGVLRRSSARFSEALYGSSVPPEVVEAVAANLTILKSTTVLRLPDGRFWAWEGSGDERGSCEGSCTHVWNYAQALPHLFPSLERTLRETEFGPNQREDGHQDFRAAMPIRPTPHKFAAAADGQLGGIMKVYRDWRISGDTAWLRSLWPKVRASLDYCIRTWDPQHKGWLEEPHHNTYDIEFWGPDGMCTSFYLGALQAAVLMGRSLRNDVKLYAELLSKGMRLAESELFNGEYFIQKVRWRDLEAQFPDDPKRDDSHKGYFRAFSPEAIALVDKEGPLYQYGEGCLADGVLGSWLAMVCGVGQVLDAAKVGSHLHAVHKYNLKKDLSAHPNPQRSTFALGHEGGVLLCTWPKGGQLSLPFIYSDEVWTGIEYHVAGHLMMMGMVEEGLEVVRTCRARYDGRSRNPFDEVEAGHWYARAMSSYGLLQALSGARYDAVDRVLHLKPALAGDFSCFLSTATGYGTVGVRAGKPFVDVASGRIPYRKIEYTARTP